MNKWKEQLRLEFKLLYSNWFFIILPVLYGVGFYLRITSISSTASQDLYFHVYEFHKVAHTMTLGITMLLGILLVRRDLDNKKYEWLLTTSTNVRTFLLPKYFFGLIYLSQFTFVMTIIYLFFAVQWGLAHDAIWRHLAFYVLQYEWSYGVTLALAMLLGTWIRHRISYLIGFLGWMFGTFFLDIFILQRLGQNYLGTFHLNQFFLESMLDNEVWGYSLLSKQIWTSRIFVLVFSLLLVVTTLWMIIKRRPSSKTRKATFALTIVMILTLSSSVPYFSLWKQQFGAYKNRYDSIPMVSEGGNSRTVWGPIESYDIQMVQKGDRRIVVESTIQFPTFKSTNQVLDFTLNRDFKVEEILINDKKVHFKRDGDFIEVPYKGDDRPLNEIVKFKYSGEIYDWMHSESKEITAAFVQGKNVFLPYQISWYPLPGKQDPYHKFIFPYGLGVATENGLLNPTDFKLTLTDFKGNIFATIDKIKTDLNKQEFEQKKAEGITLFAGNLEEMKLPQSDITFITSPGNKKEAKYFVNELDKRMNYFNSWIEDPLRINRIFYLPLSQVSNDNRFIYDESTQNNTYLIAESLHHNLDNYQLDSSVYTLLFKDSGRSYPDDSIVGALRDSFYYLYLRDGLNLSKKELEGPIPSMALVNEFNLSILSKIDQAIDTGKTKQVKEVLNYFYHKYSGLKIVDGEEPIITIEEWNQKWNQVMKNE